MEEPAPIHIYTGLDLCAYHKYTQCLLSDIAVISTRASGVGNKRTHIATRNISHISSGCEMGCGPAKPIYLCCMRRLFRPFSFTNSHRGENRCSKLNTVDISCQSEDILSSFLAQSTMRTGLEHATPRLDV